MSETHNVAWQDFSSKYSLFLAASDDGVAHGNVAVQQSSDIGCFFFLIPPDSGLEHQHPDDDTEINLVSKISEE